MRTFYESIETANVQRAETDPQEQSMRKTVDTVLNFTRPVERKHGAVSVVREVGASGFAGVHSDKEELAEVDVLDDTASTDENDIIPDVQRVFHDANDAQAIERPSTVYDTGARWKGGFRLEGALVAVLKPYQVEGVDFVLSRIHEDKGALVAHGMGLGKTLTALTVMEAFAHRRPESRLIVTCPKGMVSSWGDEIDKWCACGLLTLDGHPIQTSDGDKGTAYSVNQWSRHGGVLIVGHDQFKRMVTVNALPIEANTVVVVDEAHLLKTATTQIYAVIAQLPTNKRIFMTGTPMQNNLREYYTMIELLQPGLLGASVAEFNRVFGNVIDSGMQKDSTPQQVAASERCVTTLRLKAALVMHAMSSTILHSAIKPKHEFRILHGCKPVKEDASWIVERHNVHDAARQHKVEVAVGIIDAIRLSTPDDSIVVFSTRNDTLSTIQTLRAGGMYTGSVDSAKRDARIAAFKESKGSILYVATRAGGVGVNLSFGNRVILVDASWNPADDAQAVSRCYRMGQEKVTYVYRLIAEGTLEDGMYKMNIQKANVTARCVDEQEALRQYSRDEIMQYGGDDEQPDMTVKQVYFRDPVLGAYYIDILSDGNLHGTPCGVTIKDHDAMFSDDAAIGTTGIQFDEARNDMHALEHETTRRMATDDADEGEEVKPDQCRLSNGQLVAAFPPVIECTNDGGCTFARTVDFLTNNGDMYVKLAPQSTKSAGTPMHQLHVKSADGDDDWISFSEFPAYYSMHSAGSSSQLVVQQQQGQARRHRIDPSVLEMSKCVFRSRLVSAIDGACGPWSSPSAVVYM